MWIFVLISEMNIIIVENELYSNYFRSIQRMLSTDTIVNYYVFMVHRGWFTYIINCHIFRFLGR